MRMGLGRLATPSLPQVNRLRRPRGSSPLRQQSLGGRGRPGQGLPSPHIRSRAQGRAHPAQTKPLDPPSSPKGPWPPPPPDFSSDPKDHICHQMEQGEVPLLMEAPNPNPASLGLQA